MPSVARQTLRFWDTQNLFPEQPATAAGGGGGDGVGVGKAKWWVQWCEREGERAAAWVVSGGVMEQLQ